MGLIGSSGIDGMKQQRLIIRADDLLPSLSCLLKDSLGQPIDIADRLVSFTLRPLTPGMPDGVLDMGDMFVEDAAGGWVTFDWPFGSTDIAPGQYEILILLEGPADISSDHFGTRQVVPSSGAQAVVEVRPKAHVSPSNRLTPTMIGSSGSLMLTVGHKVLTIDLGANQ
jgi:hypothetical protein